MRCLVLVVASFGVLSACGKPPSEFIDGFEPPPVQEGFTRLITPIINDIQPGQDITYCQWIKAPDDHDILVTTATTYESKWGHHVVMFSDTANFPVGESHECKNTDMPSVRFLAGTGGDGAAVLTMPENVVTQISAGSSIMANIHFINASTSVIQGQAAVDLKLVDARLPEAAKYQVAGTVAINGDTFMVPPNAHSSIDASCVATKTMNLFGASNHMHEYGASAYTEVIRPDQTTGMIRNDPTWKREYATHPPFSMWDINHLFTVNAGDTLHTHCEWTNTTNGTLQFPTEMCVGFMLFLPSSPDLVCTNGVWDN